MKQGGPFRFIDIHCHQRRTVPGPQVAVRNILYQDARMEEDYVDFVSIGLHPWHSDSLPFSADLLTKFLQKPNVLAVGEIGLDKAKAIASDKQLQIFIDQARLANQLNKPVILHCVKSHADLLSVYKILKPATPWILHGFRGSKELVQQMVQQGFLCSFGADLLQAGEKLKAALRNVPLHQLFLETDDSSESIENIYQAASEILDLHLEELKMNIYQNFIRTFSAYV